MVLVLLIEVGQLTPPRGLYLFAIHSIASPAPIETVARSSLPYIVLIVVLCVALFALPELALWLPAQMKG